MTLTPAELHAQMSKGCGQPGCTCAGGPMFLHGKCHPKADLEVFYDGNHMALVAKCAECHSLVMVLDLSKAVRSETQ